MIWELIFMYCELVAECKFFTDEDGFTWDFELDIVTFFDFGTGAGLIADDITGRLIVPAT